MCVVPDYSFGLRGSRQVVQGALLLIVRLLPQPPVYWDHSHTPAAHKYPFSHWKQLSAGTAPGSQALQSRSALDQQDATFRAPRRRNCCATRLTCPPEGVEGRPAHAHRHLAAGAPPAAGTRASERGGVAGRATPGHGDRGSWRLHGSNFDCRVSGRLGPGAREKHRNLAKAMLRRKGVLGSLPSRPDSSGKRSVRFNKGYTALSQSPDENLVSLDSDSDGEQESRYSSGYSSAEVNQDVNRQLLQDGYHLDEIPDDEDLDLIPPKPMTSSTCSCCWCCLGDSSCTLQ
ncbi:protein FAM219B isoform X2 [Cavia porcellus]|uniref:protein FAM219B isoform X2 n=1 Tax=Cavia porcellus TaxID=10141 RepID=UPI002FDF235E